MRAAGLRGRILRAQEAQAAQPAELRPALQLLASLYGMTRVEKDAAFFLAAGALTAQDV